MFVSRARNFTPYFVFSGAGFARIIALLLVSYLLTLPTSDLPYLSFTYSILVLFSSSFKLISKKSLFLSRLLLSFL